MLRAHRGHSRIHDAVTLQLASQKPTCTKYHTAFPQLPERYSCSEGCCTRYCIASSNAHAHSPLHPPLPLPLTTQSNPTILPILTLASLGPQNSLHPISSAAERSVPVARARDDFYPSCSTLVRSHLRHAQGPHTCARAHVRAKLAS
jgi:hypothetical protein